MDTNIIAQGLSVLKFVFFKESSTCPKAKKRRKYPVHHHFFGEGGGEEGLSHISEAIESVFPLAHSPRVEKWMFKKWTRNDGFDANGEHGIEFWLLNYTPARPYVLRSYKQSETRRKRNTTNWVSWLLILLALQMHPYTDDYLPQFL